jgi:hypothetical protein
MFQRGGGRSVRIAQIEVHDEHIVAGHDLVAKCGRLKSPALDRGQGSTVEAGHSLQNSGMAKAAFRKPQPVRSGQGLEESGNHA